MVSPAASGAWYVAAVVAGCVGGERVFVGVLVPGALDEIGLDS